MQNEQSKLTDWSFYRWKRVYSWSVSTSSALSGRSKARQGRAMAKTDQ